jgi:hypothetical protein
VCPDISVDDVTVESVNGTDHAASEANQRGTARQSGLLAGGSLSLALIEALCVLFLGVSKFGILIGLASFMSAEIASPFHADRIRVPLLGAALIGAVANLFLLWNAQRLRNASAAAWRKRPLTASQRRRIVFVIAISVVTILLVVGEFWIHPIGVR